MSNDPAFNFKVIVIGDEKLIRSQQLLDFLEFLARNNPWQAAAFLEMKEKVRTAIDNPGIVVK
jgi:hypothetical protein